MAVGMALAGPALAGSVVTNPASVTGTYDFQTLDYIAAKGGMVTEIIGNPFNVPRETLEAAVNRILERSHPGQKFPFFSKVPEGFPSPYRVVVLLNQGTAYSGQRLCGESYILRSREASLAGQGAQGGYQAQGAYQAQSGYRGGPGTVEIAAALCAREIYLTSVSGRATGVDSLQSRSFEKLLNQIGHELMPRRRPSRNGGGQVFY